MEVAGCSEMSVNTCQTKRRHITLHSRPNNHSYRRGIPKYRNILWRM
jgi:hypothetical protein